MGGADGFNYLATCAVTHVGQDAEVSLRIGWHWASPQELARSTDEDIAAPEHSAAG